jgi:peptide/nickel transport system permease protein
VLSYFARRLVNSAAVLFLLTVFVFMLLRLAPGSPVYILLGPDASQEQVDRLTHELGFDQPLHVQYLRFISDLLRGDLGVSLIYQTSAAQLVVQRLPATLELAACAIALGLVLAIPIGIVTGVRRQSWVDHAGSIFTVAGVSAPAFWLGAVLIIAFSVNLRWFATSGRGLPLPDALALAAAGNPGPLADSLRHLILPTVTLAAFQMAFIARLTRSSILEELGQNYIRAARARGLPYSLVVIRHALRNALLPVITVLGLEISSLVGGAVITESVFAWPGVGQLIFSAVSGRDYPLAQAGILITAVFVVAVSLVVDMSYGVLDPRIRYRQAT